MLSFSFVYHERLSKEIQQFSKKYPTFPTARNRLEKLLRIHFDPTDPRTVIGPKSLHHIHSTEEYAIWKVICATEGLRKNQSPRVYFALQGQVFFMLCMGTHIDNYDDGKFRDLAFSRVRDLIL